jgi:hypothetical protein
MGQSTITATQSTTETESDLITQTIVEAVADAKGVGPTDLEPLYNVLDTDALDSLFHSRPRVDALTVGSVQFTYEGFDVEVTAGGDVTLEETTDVAARNVD